MKRLPPHQSSVLNPILPPTPLLLRFVLILTLKNLIVSDLVVIASRNLRDINEGEDEEASTQCHPHPHPLQLL